MTPLHISTSHLKRDHFNNKNLYFPWLFWMPVYLNELLTRAHSSFNVLCDSSCCPRKWTVHQRPLLPLLHSPSLLPVKISVNHNLWFRGSDLASYIWYMLLKSQRVTVQLQRVIHNHFWQHETSNDDSVRESKRKGETELAGNTDAAMHLMHWPVLLSITENTENELLTTVRCFMYFTLLAAHVHT